MALGISGLAAWLALTWRAELQPGEHVLVLAASGVLGQIAVQAAKLLGAGRVVAAARSQRGPRARCLALGADASVRLGELGEDLAAAAARRRPQGRIDVVVDPLFGEPFVAAVGAASFGARIVQLGAGCGRGGDGPLGGDTGQDAGDHGPHQLRGAAGGQARGLPATCQAAAARRDRRSTSTRWRSHAGAARRGAV